MLHKISIKKLNGLVVSKGNESNAQAAFALNANFMRLGFIMSKDLLEATQHLSINEIALLYNEVVPILKDLKGDNVKYKPMYPNFPQQVMEASDLELFLNAVTHYWTFGLWKPDYDELPRDIYFENTKFKELSLLTQTQVDGVFSQILSSNDSISEEDKEIVKFFFNKNLALPELIPFKENLCFVASLCLEQGKDISTFVKTATDVLRIATSLSGGDISLGSNTKFKSLPRKYRRTLVSVLNSVIREEDVARHRNKWVRLFHSLHVGEFKAANKLGDIVLKVRNNERIETFNSKVEAAITNKDLAAAIDLLMTRPGDFARRLDHLMRLSASNVVDHFLKVVDEVPTRNLLQLYGHMQSRIEDVEKRVVFPKGSTQKAVIVREELSALKSSIVEKLVSGIKTSLVSRFSKNSSLGKVWIDPALSLCPLPTQQRSASEGLFTVARGTKLPLGDENKNTLRFFIYWKGMDLDLSATLHDENFKTIEHISYTNLKSSKYEACHSGDITRAPTGASEFIDITIDKAAKYGVRYVAMNVFVFNGPTFAEHEICYAGWMTREKPNSNEIYDPATVEQKISLCSNGKNSIPVVFDLVERKAIWVDVTTKTRNYNWGNNVESNKASIEEVVEAIASSNNKVSLYELFSMHATARGTVVKTKEEADTIFSLNEGITPYNINVINSDYIK